MRTGGGTSPTISKSSAVSVVVAEERSIRLRMLLSEESSSFTLPFERTSPVSLRTPVSGANVIVPSRTIGTPSAAVTAALPKSFVPASSSSVSYCEDAVIAAPSARVRLEKPTDPMPRFICTAPLTTNGFE